MLIKPLQLIILSFLLLVNNSQLIAAAADNDSDTFDCCLHFHSLL